ncbi:MAG TPA: DUF3806 domain-containing protein [Terriglobales bacterium]|nr:DUF3806 domain-containing protein [Terriglobales bacterium]
MQQRLEDPTSDDLAHLEKQRSWVRDHFEVEARHQYEDLAGKLRLLQTILDAKWIEPEETWKLQSLGVTFGDALCQELGLTWVIVMDEFGRGPALQDAQSTALLFPLTSISKRIERGEAVEVYELLSQACKTVARIRKQRKIH